MAEDLELLQALLGTAFPDPSPNATMVADGSAANVHPLLAEARAYLDGDRLVQALLAGLERFEAGVKHHYVRLAYHPDEEPGDNRATTTWEQIENAAFTGDERAALMHGLRLELMRARAAERIAGAVEGIMRALQRSMIHQPGRQTASRLFVEMGDFYRIKDDDLGTNVYPLEAPPIG